MPSGTAQSFAVLNYSGQLFNMSDTQAPLTSMLPHRDTNSIEFVINSQFAMGNPSQPEISETQSLTAPEPTFSTREQKTNVVQPFHKTTAVSYIKQANTGTLAGINVTGQSNNVGNEFDWQMAVRTAEMRQDLEYTIINGVYQKATRDDMANKTRGLIQAITTNTVDAAGAEINADLLGDLLAKIRTGHAPTSGLILMVDANTRRQVTNNWSKLPGFILLGDRSVGGFSIDTLVTDFGNIGLMIHDMIPAGTALLVNTSVLEIVEMPIPGKGNFFWESLEKTGAGEKGQLFGMAGLDHGPEWYHGKITGLSTGLKPITKQDAGAATVSVGA